MTDLLCSIVSYQEITGDAVTATADVARELANAQGLLEDTLGRPLLQAERTENCPLLADPGNGQLACFPIVTPVISAGDLTVAFDVVFGATPIGTPLSVADFSGINPPFASLTYIGGFDPDQTDRTARDHVPTCIVRDLAWCAFHLLRPSTVTSVPAGAKAVSLGDASVTFDRGRSPGEVGVSWSRETLQWRRRRT